jgi:hypothetical protein
MDWLVQNIVPLIGHLLTIVTMIIGFKVITSQARSNFQMDQAIKMNDRNKEAMKNTLVSLENLRASIWYLYVSYPDLAAIKVNEDIRSKMHEMAKTQADLAVATVFLPPQLEAKLNKVYESLTDLKYKLELTEFEDKRRIDEDLQIKLEAWRREAIEFMRSEHDKMRAQYNFA